MALTTYTAATDIIKTLGTNPEDRPTLTDDTFKAKFDENSANIAAFLNAMITELASVSEAKGASCIGLQDSAGRFTATQVEAALAEIAGSGRTTETVKGLAGLISTITNDIVTTPTASKVLRMDEKGENFGFVSAARVYNNADISIANGVQTTLTFNSERYDNDTIHSISSNTSRLTAPTDGLYRIGTNVAFDANATGYRLVGIALGGASTIARICHPAASATYTEISLETEYRLSAGNYVEVYVIQNSGGSLNVKYLAAYSPEFWISKISD